MERPQAFSGNPSSKEERVVLAALEKMLAEQRRERTESAWKLSGRASAERVGISELRHRLGETAWSLSERLGWSNEPQANLKGRGDAK